MKILIFVCANADVSNVTNNILFYFLPFLCTWVQMYVCVCKMYNEPLDKFEWNLSNHWMFIYNWWTFILQIIYFKMVATADWPIENITMAYRKHNNGYNSVPITDIALQFVVVVAETDPNNYSKHRWIAQDLLLVFLQSFCINRWSDFSITFQKICIGCTFLSDYL